MTPRSSDGEKGSGVGPRFLAESPCGPPAAFAPAGRTRLRRRPHQAEERPGLTASNASVRCLRCQTLVGKSGGRGEQACGRRTTRDAAAACPASSTYREPSGSRCRCFGTKEKACCRAIRQQERPRRQRRLHSPATSIAVWMSAMRTFTPEMFVCKG